MTGKTVLTEHNMMCPNCGGSDAISVNAFVWLDLLPEGTTESMNGDHEWTNESPARCNDCDYSATVLDFTVQEQSECDHCKFISISKKGGPGLGGLPRCFHHDPDVGCDLCRELAPLGTKCFRHDEGNENSMPTAEENARRLQREKE